MKSNILKMKFSTDKLVWNNFLLAIFLTSAHSFADISSGDEQSFGPTEYCFVETFNVTCPDDAVIIIQRALYGRMKQGKCVVRNLGSLGCHKDVVSVLASHCSGRQHCEVPVQEPDIYNTMPCDKDVMPYLEVTHKCLKVTTSPTHKCHHRHPIEVSTPTSGKQQGYISPLMSHKYGVGTDRCPWMIKAQPGQRINVTLYSFVNRNQEKAIASERNGCYKVGSFQEANSVDRNILACSPMTNSVTHTSLSNVVNLTIYLRNPGISSLDYGSFLLKYEAVGCPDIATTGGRLVNINADRSSARVECTHTGEVRYLTCSGTSWIGDPGNCSLGQTDENKHGAGELFQHKDFPYGLLLAVAIGVALGVFLGGLLLTLVALHNRRKRQRHNSETPHQGAIYYESKPRARYCEQSSTQHNTLINTPCPNHGRGVDVTSTNTRSSDSLDKSGDYFLRPEPDLFCTIDKTYDQNKVVDRTKYGMFQHH